MGVSLPLFAFFSEKEGNFAENLYLCTVERLKREIMTTRREKAKPQKPQFNKQLEAATDEPKVKVNQRQ